MTDSYTRFVILGHARTGSTMLVQALDSNPRIMCFGEVFNIGTAAIEYGVAGYEQRSKDDLSLRASDPVAFLTQRVFGPQPGASAVGFKFHYDHFWVHEGIVDALSADQGLRIVHLMRRNRLRTLVSMRIAEQTERWLEYAPEPSARSRLNVATLAKAVRDPGRAFAAVRRKFENTPPPGQHVDRRISMTEDECRDYFQRIEYSEKYWEHLMQGHPLIRVFFEDLVQDRDAVAGRVQQFLGVEPAPVEVRTVRQNPEALRDLIANYDELRASFTGTEYEPWFDD